MVADKMLHATHDGGAKPMSSRKPYYLSDSHWRSLNDRDRELYGLIRPSPSAVYSADIHLNSLESFLDTARRDIERQGGIFELIPDFQRGHVWTQEQQVAYIEALIRNRAPTIIQFNCRGWVDSDEGDGDIPVNHFQCIDGLQRLTAARKFMAGEFGVFGGYTHTDLKGSPFDPSRRRLQFQIHRFAHRVELLQYYIDLNAGGTQHAPAEIERVRALMVEASDGAWPAQRQGC